MDAPSLRPRPEPDPDRKRRARPPAPRRRAPWLPVLRALVTVSWGDTVVAAGALPEGSEVTVGESPGSLAPLPCDEAGGEGATVTVAAWCDGEPAAVVPEGVKAHHARAGAAPVLVEGPREIPLAAGDVVSFSTGPFVITVTAGETEQAPFRGRNRLLSLLAPAPYLAVAAALHGLFIGLSAQAAEVAAIEQAPAAAAEMGRYLAAAEERSAALEKVVAGGEGLSSGRRVNDHAGNGSAAGGARQGGDQGKMGAGDSRGKHSRYSLARGADGAAEPALSREEALADARGFGMIGLAAEDGARSPSASFGQAVSSGPDPFGARGELWGASLGESFGAGGLGLSGAGEGGGGRGEGIGLGSIGTLGHGAGLAGTATGGAGEAAIWALSWSGRHYTGGAYPWIGRRRGKRYPIHFHLGAVQISRSRPDSPGADPEPDIHGDAVKRVARQNLGRLHLCYETHLRAASGGAVHSGSVSIHLLIGQDGRLLSVQSGGATFSDPPLIQCFTRSFTGLSFPAIPGGGTATAMIPVSFAWRPEETR